MTSPRHPSTRRNLILQDTQTSSTLPLPPRSTRPPYPRASGTSTTLSYHLITKHLALLALLPSTVYEEHRGLVEYNVVFFRQGVQEICAEEQARVSE